VVPKFPNPPTYSSARLLAMPEGQIFHAVTHGSGLMPPYGAQIPPDDRWKVVRWVQHLQHAVPEGPR
jgi:mono/diheme cytochrome c family protein